jgi:hypothetical protein
MYTLNPVKRGFEAKNRLSIPNKPSYVLTLVISVLLIVSFATPVSAIVPQVTNVVVWNSGGDTILNVTVYHDPETSSHYVDEIEVDVNGAVQSFQVAVQPTTTFTIPCNLGPIEGTPSATVRAHCTLHGWSSWYGPLEIPEFSLLVLLLTLTLVTSLAVFAFRKIRSEAHAW